MFSFRISADRLIRVRSNAKPKNPVIDMTGARSDDVAETRAETRTEICLELYYAVYYSEAWYMGRIIKKVTENTFKIKFLKFFLNEFVWPKTDDIQDVERQFIFYGPVRMIGTHSLTIDEADRHAIYCKYKEMKRSHK